MRCNSQVGLKLANTMSTKGLKWLWEMIMKLIRNTQLIVLRATSIYMINYSTFGSKLGKFGKNCNGHPNHEFRSPVCIRFTAIKAISTIFSRARIWSVCAGRRLRFSTLLSIVAASISATASFSSTIAPAIIVHESIFMQITMIW